MVIDHGNVYGVGVPLLHFSKIPGCYRRYVYMYVRTYQQAYDIQLYCIALTVQFVNISKRYQH